MSDIPKPSNSASPSSTSSSDDFSRQISRIAVAQICEATGFNCSSLSAIDTFSEILIRFITEIGKSAHFYSDLANRTSCNEFDVIQALEDLSSSHGFTSASCSNRCLLKSGVMKEITDFVEIEKEIPFARSLPKYPVKGTMSNHFLSFVKFGEDSGKKHIPDWLPAFPDSHTYVETPVWNERKTTAQDAKIEQAKTRRKAEKSLLRLQKNLGCCNGTNVVENAMDNNEKEKGKNVVESNSNNPFFMVPLPPGEKEITEIVSFDNSNGVETKNVTVMETFGHVIEAAKMGTFDDSVDTERNGVLKRRLHLNFKLGIGKKSVEKPINLRVFNGEKEPWFLRNDERDDKKRRAGLILQEAMEYPHELRQL